MTRASWAERIAQNKFCVEVNQKAYALGLLTEHKRAVKVVKAEIKRVKLNKYRYTAIEGGLMLAVLGTVLAALQKGRT